MKTYYVMAKFTSYVYQYVEADSYEEAWNKAHALDGSAFIDSGHGDWDIESVDEMKEQTA